MTRHDLGNETTTLVADGAELVIERIFDAPRELVWTVMTSAEHVPQWWGPHGTTSTVVEMDVRPGGRWRWIANASGSPAPFAGEYVEVVPPERYVRTVIFDVPPFNSGPPAIETLLLEDLDGSRTKVTGSTRFPSEEGLQRAISTGMSKGALESYDRLAQVLADAAVKHAEA
jgi:uncharacterized protein YndB with AHSA1/START domain